MLLDQYYHKGNPEHHETVQTGDYFPYGIYNHRAIYVKYGKYYKRNYWFLFKNDTIDAWSLAWGSSIRKFLAGRNMKVYTFFPVNEPLTGNKLLFLCKTSKSSFLRDARDASPLDID